MEHSNVKFCTDYSKLSFTDVMKKRNEIMKSLGWDGDSTCVGVYCESCPYSESGTYSCRNNLTYTDPEQFAKITMEYEIPVDWSKVKVDTPILVKDNEFGVWVRAHFAKYENGKVYAWIDGKTSWSTTCTNHWRYATLADKE